MSRTIFVILVLGFFALTKARSIRHKGCNNGYKLCPSGLICKEHECIINNELVCKSTSQCKSGYICLDGICRKRIGPSKWTQHYVKYVNELQADFM